MYVGQIVHSGGDNREFLVSDAGDSAALALAVDSKLMWHSPLFWTGSPVVQRAIEEMMGGLHCVYAWSFLDDRKFASPAWPNLRGLSPWAPNSVVSEFRLRLRDLEARVVAGAAQEPSFSDMDALLLCVQQWCTRVMDDWVPGAKAPPAPLYFPPTFWGAGVKKPERSAPSGASDRPVQGTGGGVMVAPAGPSRVVGASASAAPAGPVSGVAGVS